MTHQRFVISDYHLGHEKMLTFMHGEKRLRDFSSLEEMHQRIIDGWNSVVRDQDTVYVLGDVVINKKKGFHVLHALRGRKILVGGNHDLEDAKDYLKVFADVRGVVVFPHKAVLTHVPVHSDSLMRPSWPKNFHGHTHGNLVRDRFGKPDKRYVNVCCEQLDYIPRTIDELFLSTTIHDEQDRRFPYDKAYEEAARSQGPA